MAAASALLVASVLAPAAARAEEMNDSTGVTITVDIAPLECVRNCGGGGALPPTGAEVPSMLVWLAFALLAAGIALVVWRLRRARLSAVPATVARDPYYVVSRRRDVSARREASSASDGTSATRGYAGDRDSERGEGQCPNR